MAAQYQPVGTVFNDAAPAAQAALVGYDGMILREIARQHFAARESVIVAERHLYLTRLSRQFVPALIAFAAQAN